jgi:CRISPR-associated endoribonuclease Cas6
MLRVSLLFQTPQGEIPIDYRTAFVSLIKKTLEGTPYFDLLYKRKYPKPFTFSVYFPIKSVNGEKVYLKTQKEKETFFKLFLSSTDSVLLLHILDGLNKIKTFNWRNSFKFQFVKIEKALPPPEIKDGTLEVKTMSPIHLKDKNRKPLLPPAVGEENFFKKLEEFNREFNEIQRRIFEALNLPYGEVFILPKNWKKKVIKISFGRVKKEHNREYLNITAFDGEFILKGNEEVLKALYFKGLGQRTAEGFGMVSV